VFIGEVRIFHLHIMLAMRMLALALASLLCSGYGRRVQVPTEHRRESEDGASVKVLADLLSAVEPGTAWQAGIGRHSYSSARRVPCSKCANSRVASLEMQGVETPTDDLSHGDFEPELQSKIVDKSGLYEDLDEEDEESEFDMESYLRADGEPLLKGEIKVPHFESEVDPDTGVFTDLEPELDPEMREAHFFSEDDIQEYFGDEEALFDPLDANIIVPKQKKKKKAKPAGENSIEGYAKRWESPVPIPVSILERLRDCGYWKPMMIQERALQYIVEGESVVLHSATGSGKTLAFLLPLLTRIELDKDFRVVIATPSQELAVQIASEAEQLLPSEGSNRIVLAISSSKEIELEQQDKLFASQQMPQLLIGTPQRLGSLCRHPRARPMIRQLSAIVLDEVDLMLPPVMKKEEGEQYGKKIDLHRGGRWGAKGWASRSVEEDAYVRRKMSKKPAGILIDSLLRYRARSAAPLQIISASATVTSDVRRQIAEMMGMPEKGKKAAGRVVTADPAHAPPKEYKAFGIASVRMPGTIKHKAFRGTPEGLASLLQVAFIEYNPTAALLVIPNGKSVPAQVAELHRLGYDEAQALQDALEIAAGGKAEPEGTEARQRPAKGGMLQSRMMGKRKELSKAFSSKEGNVPLLVTNEHSARGIDFKFIDCVFLIGLPSHVDSYIHVVGRTGREGRKGFAISLITTDEEYWRLAEFRRDLGVTIEEIDMRHVNY